MATALGNSRNLVFSYQPNTVPDFCQYFALQDYPNVPKPINNNDISQFVPSLLQKRCGGGSGPSLTSDGGEGEPEPKVREGERERE